MLLHWTYWLSLVASLLDRVAQVCGDADFESVRVAQMKDQSGKVEDPTEKYFHESVFSAHYDGRFGEQTLENAAREQGLVTMVQTFLRTMADVGAETWLMHGTLMGWWWNQKVLPWDADIDVQMSIDTLKFLSSFYNMTVFQFTVPYQTEKKRYLLEINPAFANEGAFDEFNVIEARWIDTTTGLFIDITSVRPNGAAREMGIEGALNCRDKHNYLVRPQWEPEKKRKEQR